METRHHLLRPRDQMGKRPLLITGITLSEIPATGSYANQSDSHAHFDEGRAFLPVLWKTEIAKQDRGVRRTDLR